MDSLDDNDTCKRPISLQKHLYLVCQANLFRDPQFEKPWSKVWLNCLGSFLTKNLLGFCIFLSANKQPGPEMHL